MPKVHPSEVEEEEPPGNSSIFSLFSTVNKKGLESLSALGGAAQGVNNFFLITPRSSRRKNER